MASQEIKFEMKHLNESGEYDSLYPKTLSTITIVDETTAKKIGFQTTASLDEVLSKLRDLIGDVDIKIENLYTYGTEDLVEGESTLTAGKLHFVYEE